MDGRGKGGEGCRCRGVGDLVLAHDLGSVLETSCDVMAEVTVDRWDNLHISRYTCDGS